MRDERGTQVGVADTRYWANSDVLTTPAAQATHNRYSPRFVILLGEEV